MMDWEAQQEAKAIMADHFAEEKARAWRAHNAAADEAEAAIKEAEIILARLRRERGE